MPQPALALIGSADLPGFGDQVIARVLGEQLARRLPGWRIDHFGPAGSNGRDGEVVRPVGPDTATRVARLAERYRFALLAPAFSPDGPLPEDYPPDAVFPGGFRDSVRFPRRAHPALLCGGGRLAERARALRLIGVLPEASDYVVVQGTPDVLSRVDELAAAVTHAAGKRDAPHVVVLPERPGATLDRRGWWLTDLPMLDDRLAVLAGASAAVAVDEHLAAACAGLGIPCGRAETGADGTRFALALLDAEVTDPTAERAELIDVLDELAEQAQTRAEAAGQPTAVELAEENRALRAAHHALRQRMLAERHALVERLLRQRTEAANANAAAELAEERALHAALAERHRQLAADHAATRAELDALRQTKLFRWARIPRAVYRRVRG